MNTLSALEGGEGPFQPSGAHPLSFKEITHCVERMPEIEERLGIRMQGVMATVENEPSEGLYQVDIQGEIYASKGGEIASNLYIHFVCQNERDQVIGTAQHTLYADTFTGYKPFHEIVYARAFPVRIKLIPNKEPL